MARPRLKLDERQIKALAAMHCTTEEIAAVMGCSVDTLDRRFAEAMAEARATGKAKLRRLQWQKAEKGSDYMLKWLGKQLLGQTDKTEVVGTGIASHVVLNLAANGSEKEEE